MRYKNNSEIFTKENATSFYLLGAYMTDGCIMGNRIQLTSKDKNWLELIRDYISPERPINKRTTSSAVCDLKFTDKDVVSWLAQYGCVPRKSKILSIEKDIEKKFVADFIRGVVDGDGSISLISGKNHLDISMSINSASKKFLEQIQKLLPLNITSHIYEQKKRSHILNGVLFTSSCPLYVLRIYGQNAQKLLQFIYYPNHGLSLDRKYQIALRSFSIKYLTRGKKPL